MDVTPAGMVMEVIAFAPSNAFAPMDVTPLGTTTDPTHPLLPVTTLEVIVKLPDTVPDTVQSTVPEVPS